MKKIQIIVNGKSGVGKSTIINIIKEALESKGIENFKLKSSSNDFKNKEEFVEQEGLHIENKINAIKEKDLEIEIVENSVYSLITFQGVKEKARDIDF